MRTKCERNPLCKRGSKKILIYVCTYIFLITQSMNFRIRLVILCANFNLKSENDQTVERQIELYLKKWKQRTVFLHQEIHGVNRIYWVILRFSRTIQTPRPREPIPRELKNEIRNYLRAMSTELWPICSAWYDVTANTTVLLMECFSSEPSPWTYLRINSKLIFPLRKLSK